MPLSTILCKKHVKRTVIICLLFMKLMDYRVSASDELGDASERTIAKKTYDCFLEQSPVESSHDNKIHNYLTVLLDLWEIIFSGKSDYTSKMRMLLKLKDEIPDVCMVAPGRYQDILVFASINLTFMIYSFKIISGNNKSVQGKIERWQNDQSNVFKELKTKLKESARYFDPNLCSSEFKNGELCVNNNSLDQLYKNIVESFKKLSEGYEIDAKKIRKELRQVKKQSSPTKSLTRSISKSLSIELDDKFFVNTVNQLLERGKVPKTIDEVQIFLDGIESPFVVSHDRPKRYNLWWSIFDETSTDVELFTYDNTINKLRVVLPLLSMETFPNMNFRSEHMEIYENAWKKTNELFRQNMSSKLHDGPKENLLKFLNKDGGISLYATQCLVKYDHLGETNIIKDVLFDVVCTVGDLHLKNLNTILETTLVILARIKNQVKPTVAVLLLKSLKRCVHNVQFVMNQCQNPRLNEMRKTFIDNIINIVVNVVKSYKLESCYSKTKIDFDKYIKDIQSAFLSSAGNSKKNTKESNNQSFSMKLPKPWSYVDGFDIVDNYKKKESDTIVNVIVYIRNYILTTYLFRTTAGLMTSMFS
ncbi:uncharacterized protein LOC126844864 isoform X2 [Adelges cooleyi]|uniref:uncharacterized protein LOC126844864 isoform X2 n=1 Tax=Adelges cooleyi TaxID=133065 RepID=UPI0021805DDC|nr:uncharacterized protein LOC126844864 isoform X2 [Adelges cooleyi]